MMLRASEPGVQHETYRVKATTALVLEPYPLTLTRETAAAFGNNAVGRKGNAFLNAVPITVVPPAVAQALRYGSIGSISALVELGLFHLFSGQVGMPIMMANVIAVASVTVFGFVAQKRFTFRDTQKTFPQAGLYALMGGLSFGLNNALVFAFAVLLGMPPVTAKILQLGIGYIFNFSFSKYVVFRDHR
jgi:putative flippase GtrA